MADDCMGLSQQVAYSSLLAFFPAMMRLIALLDLVGAFGTLQSFLNPVAPQSVTGIIDQLEKDSSGAGRSCSSSSACSAPSGRGAVRWARS